MKKKAVFILIGVLILGGIYMTKKIDSESKIDVQKKRIEMYINYNYKDIESITFTNSKKVPTSGTYIEGYVNNDKKLDFSGWLTPDTFEGQFSLSEKLSKLAKYKENKTPEEIEKEGK